MKLMNGNGNIQMSLFCNVQTNESNGENKNEIKCLKTADLCLIIRHDIKSFFIDHFKF